MKKKRIAFLKHPEDYVIELARIANEPIIKKAHSLFIKCDNNVMTGLVEFNYLADSSFVECSSLTYKKVYEEHFFLQFIEDWLKITLYINDSNCLLASEIIQSNSVLNERVPNQMGILLKSNVRACVQTSLGITKKVTLYVGRDWLQFFFGRIHVENTVDCFAFFEELLDRYEFFEIEKTHPMIAWINKLLNSSVEKDDTFADSRKGELHNFVIQAVNLLVEKRLINSIHKLDSDLDRIILSAKYLLSYDFKKKPPSLDKLVKMTCMNRDKFQKMFKSYYGKTFYQFFQDARFLYAHHLVYTKGVSLQEAAYMCGYKHVNHFMISLDKRTPFN